MSASSVVYLKPRAESLAHSSQQDSPLILAYRSALQRTPPKPSGFAACVAYLQESAPQLMLRSMGLRALTAFRAALFVAPGRDAEMGLLWREAVATACFAREVAEASRFNSPLLTGAGLLHRVSEIVALRSLAQAERDCAQRLSAMPMQEALAMTDDELVTRVTRCWAVPQELRLVVTRWREEQGRAEQPEAVRLLTMAQALATELVHASTCTPGLVDAACETLHVSPALVANARAASVGIGNLLEQLSPAA
jgi:HDOD domain